MEQPVVALDCKTFGDDGKSVSVLAVLESGVAYIWHSESVEMLNSAKPSKVTISLQICFQVFEEEWALCFCSRITRYWK